MKTYRLLQLNVLNFVYFDSIVQLINSVDPDIVTFQEVSENNLMRSQKFADTAKYNNKNYIEELQKQTRLKYGEFFKSWGVKFENGKICNWGIGIFAKFPVIDYSFFFDKQNGNYTLTNKGEDPFFTSEDKKIRDIYSMQKPSVFANCLLELDGTRLKVFTGHFAISDLCTESLQRINQVRQLLDFFDSQKKCPAIISADFNMSEEGISIKLLKGRFDYMTENINNSLNKEIHPIFDPTKAIKGITVDNLKVDHILGSGIKFKKSYSYDDKAVSDHLPIIFEFEL